MHVSVVKHRFITVAWVVPCRCQVAQPGNMYSLDLHPNADGEMPVVRTLDDVLQESMSKRRRLHSAMPAVVGSLRLEVDVDVADDGPPSGVGRDVIYFRLVHAAPGNMHTVRMSSAAGRHCQRDEIALSCMMLWIWGRGRPMSIYSPLTEGDLPS